MKRDDPFAIAQLYLLRRPPRARTSARTRTPPRARTSARTRMPPRARTSACARMSPA